METNDIAFEDISTGKLQAEHEEVSSSGGGIQKMESLMVVLNRVALDLAFSDEKLVNLHALLMFLLSWGEDHEAMVSENSILSAKFLEKAMLFDLLSGILDSELREVESFLAKLHAEVVDARHKISSCRLLRQLCTIMEEKLLDSEESLKQLQEQVLEMKMQSTELQKCFSYFRQGNRKNDKVMDISQKVQLSSIKGKSKRRTAGRQRNILRIMEKCLARELDLEKKLSELGENEEQLKLKLHHTEQVALRMEEAAGVVWGRFLEAENASEVLMGISKELLGRLQVVQLNMNGSVQREDELKSKLQGCVEELNAKNIAIEKLERSNAELTENMADVFALREKVKLLEEQLKQYERHLKNAYASNKESQVQVHELEGIIESLKDSMYEAGNRAESSEAKVKELTDTNMELNEELNFLKGNNDSNTKKVTSLEKQLRELEIQLQHAKASSEASQEQQNLLYAAIWDMETLIEDLKSKVSKAESKTEDAEDQCIILSETNFELNTELSLLRDRIQCLETSLEQANDAKEVSAKEINHRTKMIMDMVVQLATERERVQNQLCSATNERKTFAEKFPNTEKVISVTMCETGDGNEIEMFSKNDSTEAACTSIYDKAVPSAASSQVDEPSKDALLEGEAEAGAPTGVAAEGISTVDAVKKVEAGRLKLCINVLVLVFSVLAVYFLSQKPAGLPS